MTFSLILAAIAVATGQGQTEPKAEDVCMEFFREGKRAAAFVNADKCAELIGRSNEDAIHSELIDLALSWARYLDTTNTPGEVLDRDREAARKRDLLYAVVRHGLEPLSRDPNHAEEILKLLTRVLTKTWLSLHAPVECYPLLEQLNVPEESKRGAVLEVIERYRRHAALPLPLLDLLDVSYFPHLVALVEESDDPETFHFCAAAALAHFGYQGILPRLESLRPSFRAKHPNIEGYLVHFAWQIEIQNPPEKLIVYIGSKPGVRVEERLWAVGRAVEVGLPKEQIRDAILGYVSQVEPDSRGFRPGAISLKEIGIELGILSSSDLPDVPLPDARRRP